MDVSWMFGTDEVGWTGMPVSGMCSYRISIYIVTEKDGLSDDFLNVGGNFGGFPYAQDFLYFVCRCESVLLKRKRSRWIVELNSRLDWNRRLLFSCGEVSKIVEFIAVYGIK